MRLGNCKPLRVSLQHKLRRSEMCRQIRRTPARPAELIAFIQRAVGYSLNGFYRRAMSVYFDRYRSEWKIDLLEGVAAAYWATMLGPFPCKA